MTVDEVAELFGIERDAVYKTVRRGQLRAQKIGRDLVFDGEHVRDLYEASQGKRRGRPAVKPSGRRG